MNSFIAVTTLIALCLFLNNQPAQSAWEKRAVAETQRVLASDLDAELPKLSFADWFEKVVGPRTGVLWQVSECGDRMEASPDATGDMRACVEVNSVLPDDRKVIVMVSVGTFKKGMTGAPAFHFGVIDRDGELYPIRRLRDLQKLLSAPEKSANSIAVSLPEVSMPRIRMAANNTSLIHESMLSGVEIGLLTQTEEPPAPPPPQTGPASSNARSTARNQNVSGEVLQGAAIAKPQPAYPRGAAQFKASGPVEVQVTISEKGRVTAAKAISGHPMLRKAAEDAARRWEFNPTTVNGVPMETQLVLTFVFNIPQ
jgi:TonB family protein